MQFLTHILHLPFYNAVFSCVPETSYSDPRKHHQTSTPNNYIGSSQTQRTISQLYDGCLIDRPIQEDLHALEVGSPLRQRFPFVSTQNLSTQVKELKYQIPLATGLLACEQHKHLYLWTKSKVIVNNSHLEFPVIKCQKHSLILLQQGDLFFMQETMQQNKLGQEVPEESDLYSTQVCEIPYTMYNNTHCINGLTYT